MRGMLLCAGMWLCRSRHWRPLVRMTQRPDLTQRDVLLRLLRKNASTRFGIEHGFSRIRDTSQFQDQVPVQSYESLRPYIDEQRTTGSPALTTESPMFYAQTSGTTGQPKYIPITPTILAMHRAEQALFSYLQYRACPQAFDGKALGIMGAAVETHLDTGHAVGSVSGHLYQSLPGVIRSRFVVPPIVFNISDYTLKYLVVLRLALAESDITYLGSPNPSTFLRMQDLLNDQREFLLHSLETGEFTGLNGLDSSLRQSIEFRLKPNPARAKLLRSLSSLSFANVWPDLKLVTTWTNGSCGIVLDSLRKSFPEKTRIMELGYQSTECRGTLALQVDESGGLPSLHHHFMEFVEQHLWDDGRPEFLTIERIEPGRRYYILFTTAAGLYRYFMNDLVEVAGYYQRTPLLRFVQKGKGVTSLTGEKLYEAQAIVAVQTGLARYNIAANFFVLIADEQLPGYRLFIETNQAGLDVTSVAAEIDKQLGELNIEYQSKRMSGRLTPLTIAWLKRGTAEANKAACVHSGQRESQFKAAVLQYRALMSLPFDDYMI